MQLQWDPVGFLAVIVGLVYVLLAGLVYFAAPRRSANRWLAIALFLESVASQGVIASGLCADEGCRSGFFALDPLASWAVVWLYLGFIARALPVDFLRPLRSRGAGFAIIATILVGIGLFRSFPGQQATWEWFMLATGIPIFLLAFVAALMAWRRARPGTLERSRGRAFAIAFGIRDLGVTAVILALRWMEAATSLANPWFVAFYESVAIGFLLALTYGILKTQLFEIDLHVRHTIRTGIPPVAYLGVIFVVAQIVENGLDQRFGWLWGSVAAGLLLVALQPVQRFAERVATAAVPGARTLASLNAAERRSLYADHARVAWEDGSIDRSDRALLDNLRVRLGLEGDLAARLEREAARL